MDKIIEISLAKIENCKSKKICGKSSTLHKSLLVNTLLNRVRGNSSETRDPLMNYRESKAALIDMDIDEIEVEKLPPLIPSSRTQKLTNKQSSLVTKLSSRSIGNNKSELKLSDKSQENIAEISCECSTENRRLTKRTHVDSEDGCSPSKKLCKKPFWPTDLNPKHQEPCYAISNLSSLFNDLVAHTVESESSAGCVTLSSSFSTTMIAC